MLQVWKINAPINRRREGFVRGWALAESAEEAGRLLGQDFRTVEADPERLWIKKERVVWEKMR